MTRYRNSYRRNLFFIFLATIFLAGCNPLATSQMPYTGSIPTSEAFFPTHTMNPTVTPIADRPTRTPRGLLIPPLLTVPPGSVSTPIPGSEGLETPSPNEASMPAGRLSGRTLGLIPSRNGLWAMYPNGARLTLLTTDPILHLSVSPTGWSAAYITNPDPEIFIHEKPYGYTLKVITFYDQRIYTVTTLNPPGLSADSSPDVLDSTYQAVQAFRHGALAWSPNGLMLAFTSLHETSPEQTASSNVYVHSLGSGSLRRLTTLELPQGAGHPYGLSWSPFGEGIYYAVAYNFGTGAGFPMAGAWISLLSGPTVQLAPGEETAGEELVAWQTAGTFLLSSWNPDCGDQNLRKVHLQSGMRGIDVTPLWPGCYSTAQYNPLRDEILLSVTAQQGFPTGQSSGVYLISMANGQARHITSQGFERVFTTTNRRADTNSPAWFGYNLGQGLFSILRDGTVQPLFTGPPFDGSGSPTITPIFPVSDTEWLWSGNGLYVCRPGEPPQQITDLPVSSVSGAPGVDGLYYFMAPVEDSMQMFAVRAGDWQPYVVDERIAGPQRLEWTGP